MSGLRSPRRLVYGSLLLLLLFFSVSTTFAAQTSLTVQSINFGKVQAGSSLILPMTVADNGNRKLTIQHVRISGSGFSFAGPNLPMVLTPQQQSRLSLSFSPQAAGAVSGTATVVYWVAATATNKGYSGRATAVLSGTEVGPGTGYLGAPSSMNLGSVAVGTSLSRALTLSNTGGSSLTISAANVTGSGFTVSGLPLPYTLAAGTSANLSVTFSPTKSGSDIASLAIASNASDPSVKVALSGTATTTSGALTVTPGSMNFGSITVGSTQTKSGSVTASSGSVTLSSASSSNAEFTLGGLTLPVTLAAGQSVHFTVTFAPTAAGAASANISFSSGNSTTGSETASGSGAMFQHTVDLSWNASTSSSVAGYNVYRASSATGSYVRINSALNPSMNYNDSTVQSGQTYYYATTAVDSSGAESTYSNRVQVVVPFP